MKKFEKLLKCHNHIAFLDFEGTQYSHEMIAIGAILVSIDKKGYIKKAKEPFKIYVKAHNKIGKYVTELTGISEEKLQADGVSFNTAMLEFKKYMGLNLKKSSFVTFGNHDMRILNQSISYSFDFPKEVCSAIQKNFIDFSAFLSEFVKDQNGNPLSLHKYCELYGVQETGTAHDPEADAINLAYLYDAVMKNPDLTVEEYKKVLQKPHHMPDPIAKVIIKLAQGEDVTVQEFEEGLKEYIK